MSGEGVAIRKRFGMLLAPTTAFTGLWWSPGISFVYLNLLQFPTLC